MGSVTRFLNGASQEIKVKLNESWQLKFYHDKQLKKNSTENSAKKDFKEDSQFDELWNISTNKKEMKNAQIQRTLFPEHYLRYVPANCNKICDTSCFLSLSFLFLLYKIPF